MLIEDGSRCLAATAATTAVHDPFSSRGEVTYSCGSCGYALNLSSSNRNMTNFGSKYGKAIRKGIISFFSIDESRFSKNEEYRCIPYFISKHSWGLFQRRTKLQCRKCGNHIGVAYDESHKSENSDPSCGNGSAAHKYKIRISALQPSSDESLIPSSYDL